MFCRHCGKEIPDDSIFCPECGSNVAFDTVKAPQRETHQEPYKEVRGKAAELIADPVKRNKTIAKVIAGAFILVVILAMSSIFIKPKINLNNYLIVEFEGENGNGYANVSMDYEKLAKDHGRDLLTAYQNQKNINPFAKSIFDDSPYLKSLYNKKNMRDDDMNGLALSFIDKYIDGDFEEDKNYGLSNGDTITFIWDVNTESVLELTGIKLVCKDKELTVEGLLEGIIFQNSSYELIENDQIHALSDNDLRSAINEIFARHGYIFEDEQLREFYSQFSWYHPYIEPEDFYESILNDIEYQNVEAMQNELSRRK